MPPFMIYDILTWTVFEGIKKCFLGEKQMSTERLNRKKNRHYFCFCYCQLLFPFLIFKRIQSNENSEHFCFCFVLGEKRQMQLYWRLSRELTKCFMSGFVSQGQSIQRRPADCLRCRVCAGDFIWELTPFCGCRSIAHCRQRQTKSEKNGKVKRK